MGLSESDDGRADSGVLQNEADGLWHGVTDWFGCCQRPGLLQVVLVQGQRKKGGCECVGAGRISGDGSASQHSDRKGSDAQSLAVGEEVAVICGDGIGCHTHSGTGIQAVEGDLQCIEHVALQNCSKCSRVSSPGQSAAGNDSGLAEFVEDGSDALRAEDFIRSQ